MPRLVFLLVSCLTLGVQAAEAEAPSSPSLGPTVTLDRGKFIGIEEGPNVQFLGIPFAQPASGYGRFRIPRPNLPYTGVHNATAFGPACFQQDTGLPSSLGTLPPPPPMSEDCLTINVITPKDATPASKLPVAVWVYGGGFELGYTAQNDGGVIVNRSIELGEPVVYVSMNYRLNGFGFLSSKEVKAAGVGNLGLRDQREAFRWVQKYIHAFGGDSTKVTIWGESAGSISVGLHMAINGGNPEGLFRGAVMQSGSPNLGADITAGQEVYDKIVTDTGCGRAMDTLSCLRTVPTETLFASFNATPKLFDPIQALNLTWEPRVDGSFFPEGGKELVARGIVAPIPMINSDCDDEGTLFSIQLSNITTDDDVVTFAKNNYFPKATTDQMNKLKQLYPKDPTAGSPFDTGTLNAIFPQYKRLAALQGDLFFHGPRRFLFQDRADKQPIFSYLTKEGKSTPVLGARHGSDLSNIYGGGALTDYLVHFVNNLDPNGPLISGEVFNWPQYTLEDRQLLTLNDAPAPPLTMTTDDFRAEAISFVANLG